MSKRSRKDVANELERIAQRRLPPQAMVVVTQQFFQTVDPRLFIEVCVKLLDYQTVRTLEQLSVQFKSLIINNDVWEKKFKLNFPGLRNVEMTPYLRGYIDARSQQLTDPAGSRDWKQPRQTLVQDRYRDYTLWKRYYELIVKLPTHIAQLGEPLEGYGRISSVAWSPDGTRLSSVSSSVFIRIWDVATQSLISFPIQQPALSVSWSPDGKRIASGSNDIRIWDVKNGSQIGEPLREHDEVVRSVSWSPDGTRLASAAEDRTVRIWDATTGSQIGEPLLGHTKSVYSVTWSPDGTRLASASKDRTIRIWDATTGSQIGEPLLGHSGIVNSVSWSPDGTRLASASLDRTIRIWDATTGSQIGEPLLGHSGMLYSVSWSPNGTQLAIGGSKGMIRIWGIPADGQTLVSHRMLCVGCKTKQAKYVKHDDHSVAYCGAKCAFIRP